MWRFLKKNRVRNLRISFEFWTAGVFPTTRPTRMHSGCARCAPGKDGGGGGDDVGLAGVPLVVAALPPRPWRGAAPHPLEHTRQPMETWPSGWLTISPWALAQAPLCAICGCGRPRHPPRPPTAQRKKKIQPENKKADWAKYEKRKWVDRHSLCKLNLM